MAQKINFPFPSILLSVPNNIILFKGLLRRNGSKSVCYESEQAQQTANATTERARDERVGRTKEKERSLHESFGVVEVSEIYH